MCEISHYITAYHKAGHIDYELKNEKERLLVNAKCQETKDTFLIKSVKYFDLSNACDIKLLITEFISRARNWDKKIIKGNVKVDFKQGDLIEKCFIEKGFLIEMKTHDKIIVFRHAIDLNY
jgi:hypothetical protein